MDYAHRAFWSRVHAWAGQLLCIAPATPLDLSLIHIFTMMVGGAMSGYCSTGKVNNPMMPSMTIVMEMTAEKTASQEEFSFLVNKWAVLGIDSVGDKHCYLVKYYYFV